MLKNAILLIMSSFCSTFIYLFYMYYFSYFYNQIILFTVSSVNIKDCRLRNWFLPSLVRASPAAFFLPPPGALWPVRKSVLCICRNRQKKGLFLTILILYSVANAAELLPMVVGATLVAYSTAKGGQRSIELKL